MTGSDLFDRHAALTQQSTENMRMRDCLAGLFLRAEPAHAVLMPNTLSADGERMRAARHRQMSAEPRKLMVDCLGERARPQRATHIISGTEQTRPKAGTRNRASRYEAKVHDVHAEQAGGLLA